MQKIIQSKLSVWRLVYQNERVRDSLIRFSVWILQLLNHIDETNPDIVYILPDYLI